PIRRSHLDLLWLLVVLGFEPADLVRLRIVSYVAVIGLVFLVHLHGLSFHLRRNRSAQILLAVPRFFVLCHASCVGSFPDCNYFFAVVASNFGAIYGDYFSAY